MWRTICPAITLLFLADSTSCYIWELTKTSEITSENPFQRIPSAQETADKIMRYFLGLDWRVIKQMKRRRYHRSLEKTRSYAQYDAIFVIDSSGSISLRDFRRMLHALSQLTTKAEPERKYAAISFSDNATLRFNFTSKGETMVRLGQIPFEAGKTNTQDALQMCRKKLIYSKNGNARPGVSKRVLIVTDGQSNVDKQKTLYEAFKLKNTGTQVFVIAVGKYLSGINEIVTLASSTDAHLYRVRDSRGLLEVVRLIPPWHIIKSFMQRTWLNIMLRPETTGM